MTQRTEEMEIVQDQIDNELFGPMKAHGGDNGDDARSGQAEVQCAPDTEELDHRAVAERG